MSGDYISRQRNQDTLFHILEMVTQVLPDGR